MPVELGRRQIIYVTLLLVVFASFLSFYRVDEALHEDSVLWYGAVKHFWAAIARGDFANTRPYPHPGVTLMWISGLFMKLDGTLAADISPVGVFAVKLPGALIGVLSAALTFPLAIACLGQSQWRPALVLALLLVTDAALVEQARIGQLDMAALGLAWLGAWTAILAYERGSWRWALGAGPLFAASALCKLSYGAVPATLLPILAATTVLDRFRDKRGLMVAFLVSVSAALAFWLMWPALWVSPVRTLHRVIHETVALANHGHPHVVDGQRVRDPGLSYYPSAIASVAPPETLILAAFGLVALGFLPRLRKHYCWLLLSFIPYLLMVVLASKKHARYASPALSMLCLLAGASIEWLTPRLQAWSKRMPFAPMALLALLFVGRYVRDVRLLPEAEPCTPWPGVECGRPQDKNFMREMALGIASDWQARGRTQKPHVFVGQPQLMSPWLRAKKARSPQVADYVVVWDKEFDDPESGSMGQRSRERFGRLGKELLVVRRSGRVVARVFRKAR
ncbi:MAG: glycosyltransferase family 39 protein [Myxococcales bacterium]